VKCAIFIDGNNLFHSAKQSNVEIDYLKLLNVLKGTDRTLMRAFFYTGVDENADKQRGFLHWMRRNGFRVQQQQIKLDRDGVRKAQLEVKITTDMMAFSDKVDTIVLVSGSEEFAYPLSVLAQRGLRIEVAGFRASIVEDGFG